MSTHSSRSGVPASRFRAAATLVSVKRFLTITALLLIVVLAYPTSLALRIWHQSRRDEVFPADAIVVLGAAQYNGRPSPVFEARLNQAIHLYRTDVSKRIVVTGGRRAGDRFSEARVGRMYLQTNGVPAPAILGEAPGNTTLDSLRQAGEIARTNGADSLLLVSDPLHSERIKQIANDLGFEDAYASWASYQQLDRSFDTKFGELMHEVASLAAYELLER